MLSVRDAFFGEIYKLVKSDEDICVITADLGAPSLDDFRRDFPERYISVGIAEQSLVSVASGLSLGGKKVVAYGLNPFPATRAFDQVRCLMAELNVPITLCALNAGLCSAECGYTHMPVEDVGMMRMLGNIRTFNPTDETIAVKLARETAECKYPRFIRFDKSLKGTLYSDAQADLADGFVGLKTDAHYDIGVVTSGCYAKELREWTLNETGVQLIDIFEFPNNKDKLIESISKCDAIVTVEENVLSGGVGSYISELLSDRGMHKPLKRLGLNFENGYYDVFTSREYIRKDQGLSVERIIRTIETIRREK